jgi:hypothetical protein
MRYRRVERNDIRDVKSNSAGNMPPQRPVPGKQPPNRPGLPGQDKSHKGDNRP